MADPVFAEYITGDNGDFGIYGLRWYGQTFTPTLSFTATSLRLKLFKTGTPGPFAYIHITAVDGSHHPTGDSLSFTVHPTSSIPLSTPTWVEIPLDQFPTLTGGTEYAIWMATYSSDFANSVRWRSHTATSAYAGFHILSSDDAGTWTAVNLTDFMFQVRGTGTGSVHELESSDCNAVSATTADLIAVWSMDSGDCDAVSATTADLTLTGTIYLESSDCNAESATTADLTAIWLLQSAAACAAESEAWASLTHEIYAHGPACAAVSATYGKLVTALKTNAEIIRLIPFIYSASTAYVVEFGHEYARFFYDDVPLLEDPDDDDSDHVEVETPYDEDDLLYMQFQQIGNVMWLTHPDYPPYKLTRTSAFVFALDEITFEDGPFLTRNDLDSTKDDAITMTASAIDAAATGTLTASSDDEGFAFETDHIDALFRLTHPRANRQTGADGIVSDGNWAGDAIEIYGAFTFRIEKATWDGEISLKKRPVGEDDWAIVKTFSDTNNKEREYEGLEEAENVEYRIWIESLTDIPDGGLSTSVVENTSTVSGKKTTNTTGIIGYDIAVKGDFEFNTHGKWDGTIVLERNENSAGWETYRTYTSKDDRNIQFSGTESANNVRYRMNVTQHKSGTIFADLTATSPTVSGIVRVDSITSTTVAEITVVSALASATPTKRWAEGAWSTKNGFPGAVGFFEGRVIYGGTDENPQTLWLSAADDYQTFEEGLIDDNSFSLMLTTTSRIAWISSLESLLVGCAESEWVIASSKLETPLTPTNFAAKQKSTYGSAPRQAIRVGSAVLFEDSVGQKVRELTYLYDQDSWKAPDLTVLAEHVTRLIIYNMDLQKNPDTILWCALLSGELVGMVYERDQNVVAWARFPIDGEVQSVAVIPGWWEDEVWISVVRTTDDTERIFVERFRPRLYTGELFYVDSGVTYDTEDPNLGHLENETVSILKNNVVQDQQVVSGGAITGTKASDSVQVGLPYTSLAIPMRLDVDTRGGTSQGSIKRTAEVVLSVYQTAGIQAGRDEDHLKDVQFKSDEPDRFYYGLYTGDVMVSLDAGFGTQDDMVISQDAPLPCVIRAIVPRMEVTGR